MKLHYEKKDQVFQGLKMDNSTEDFLPWKAYFDKQKRNLDTNSKSKK